MIGGAAFALGGICLGLQQMLSAPDRPNYPTAGPWTRFVMFWLSALLIARGLEVCVKALRAEPVALTGLGAAVAVLVFCYFSASLYSHLSQRASKRTHRLIQRLHTMARCAPKDSGVAAARRSAGGSNLPASVVPEALIALSLDGVRVAGPNEGPEAFTGPWQ